MADDQVRRAQAVLASRLRVLAMEAHDVAVQLELAGPHDRVESRVEARHSAVREAIARLSTARRQETRTRA